MQIKIIRAFANPYKTFKTFILFIFIFSIFNDKFIVDYIHSASLKVIIMVFIVTNIQNLKFINYTSKSKTEYAFLVFLSLLLIVSLFQYVIYESSNLEQIFPYFLSFLIIYYYVSFAKNFDEIIFYIWISVLISVVLCFFLSYENIRLSGGTLDPNHFAAHIILFGLLGGYLTSKYKSSIILIITVPLAISGLIMAGSKTSFIVVGILILLTAISNIHKIYRIFFSFRLIILVIALVWGVERMLPVFEDNLNAIEKRSENTASAEHRFKSWEAGVKMVEENPWMGVGFFNYAEHTYKYAGRSDFAPAAHNIYLGMWAESGSFVFISFIVFLYYLLSKNFIYISNSIYVYIQYATIAYLMMGMTLSIGYSKDLWLVFSLLINVSVYQRFLK